MNDNKTNALLVSTNADIIEKSRRFLNDTVAVQTADTPEIISDTIRKESLHALIVDMGIKGIHFIKLLIRANQIDSATRLVVIADDSIPDWDNRVVDHCRFIVLPPTFDKERLRQAVTGDKQRTANDSTPLSVFDMVALYCLSKSNVALTFMAWASD